MHSFKKGPIAAMVVLALFATPGTAFAVDNSAEMVSKSIPQMTASITQPAYEAQATAKSNSDDQTIKSVTVQRRAIKAATIQKAQKQLQDKKLSSKANKSQVEAKIKQKTNKILAYDPKLIAQIGTQEQTGHTICCPSFSCAYADCVMDGTVNDHSYYTCSCCTWTDWGGGGSSDRYVGTDEELLREAYDQIAAGKPTVIHVTSGSGEHWIALIGYKNATDPDHLTLDNFIALDPWDGAKITASKRYSLYGDGCEHISSR